MEQKSNGKQSVLEAVLSATAGCSIVWLTWLATGNIVVTLLLAGPIAGLTKSLVRKVMTSFHT